MPAKKKQSRVLKGIDKAPTGIVGLDQITFGGLPKGRTTLICGNAGCGKTLMALEIIIRGALEFNEPGIFLSFEERKEDLIKNVASMGFDLAELERKNLLRIEYICIDEKEFTEIGAYDLEGLFIRIDSAVKKISAKRIAIDTVEVLFMGFLNQAIVRTELKRLFFWLKDKHLTTILTGEEGTNAKLTRHGIEEYVADCVISLTNIVSEDLYTRRLQIIKYRGSFHETNRFPFLITHQGISLLPITSLNMSFPVSNLRISTGIPELDVCLSGKGYYEGSSILISGSSGAGKTTFAAAFARSICQKKQKCLFLTYEESEKEVLRNLLSVGFDFKQYIKDGFLKIINSRPTQCGLERHLGLFMEEIEAFKPHAVVVDPINTLAHCGSDIQVYSLVTRMIDNLKRQNVTFVMTLLLSQSKTQDFTYGLSSVIDTWFMLRSEEKIGELTRDLLIIKSRGMGHSNQVREFSLSSKGISIREPYYGEAGVLTGTARIIQEHKDIIEKETNLNTLQKLRDEVELKSKLIEIQIQGLKNEFACQEKEAKNDEKLIKYKEEASNSIKKVIKKSRI
ncbi:MAG: circadian clock protein KaiC [Parachlamydiaceae bacterium]